MCAICVCEGVVYEESVTVCAMCIYENMYEHVSESVCVSGVSVCECIFRVGPCMHAGEGSLVRDGIE